MPRLPRYVLPGQAHHVIQRENNRCPIFVTDNAHGKSDLLVNPHVLYQALGSNEHQRQATYRGLFKTHIDDKTLEAIRLATQKGWALGNDRFKDQIECLLNRRTQPLPRGGDHRSIAFRKGKT